MSAPTEGFLPPGTPLADYLAIPGAMSSSGLEKFRRSPLHYRHALKHPDPETDAMRFGTAVHTAVLETGRYRNDYVVLHGCEATLKNGMPCSYPAKTHADGLGYCGRHDPLKGARREGLSIKQDDHERVLGILLALRKHPMACSLLLKHAGEAERSGIFRDEETGVLCRMRPDRLVTVQGLRVCVDLKTCRDAGPAFWRTIADRGYHRQASLYQRGLAKLGSPVEASVIVAVESAPPHGVGCFLLADEDLARAHNEITALLESYARCLETEVWPGYSEELHERRLPDWAFGF